jgi:hypothetical protein
LASGEVVEFLAKLQKWNRVQVPVEVRWRYKLERGELLRFKVCPVGRFAEEEFVARLMGGGRITRPWEVAWALKLDKPGYMLRVRVSLKGSGR